MITFYDTCATLTPTVVENTFSGGITVFNLLTDTSKSITLPTLTVTPADCAFTMTWVVKRTADNQDMAVAMSSVFAISGSNLQLSNTVSDYTLRKSLYGNMPLYFLGTINDQANTQSAQKTFNVDFTDAC